MKRKKPISADLHSERAAGRSCVWSDSGSGPVGLAGFHHGGPRLWLLSHCDLLGNVWRVQPVLLQPQDLLLCHAIIGRGDPFGQG